MRSVVLLLVWLALATPGWAQVAPPPGPDPATILAQAKSDLNDITTGLKAGVIADSDIEARLARITPIQARLVGALSTLTPRQEDLQARLAQLGPAPAA